MGPEYNASQRIREWRPQTTVNALSKTQVGFSTAFIPGNANIAGLGGVGGNPGPMMGFISSRHVFAILPAHQLTSDTNTRKRRSNQNLTVAKEKFFQQKESNTKSRINADIPNCEIDSLPLKKKVCSSGVVHDRGKVSRNAPAVSLPEQMSSPDQVWDLDALPSVSFSSPNDSMTAARYYPSPMSQPQTKSQADVPTSPIAPVSKENRCFILRDSILSEPPIKWSGHGG